MAMPQALVEWRKRQRAMLLARREAIAPDQRAIWNAAITLCLLETFPLDGFVIGFCWPYRGEFDARFAIRHWRERGARTALPVVAAKRSALEFREWWPGAPTAPGVFGLPVPQGTEIMRPAVLLVPPIGFDAHGYRLGYGGGYFDRTLASMSPQPLKIGVAYELSRIPTIRPQPHDIPMDFIVTEQGVYQVDAHGMAPVTDTHRARAHVAERSRTAKQAHKVPPAAAQSSGPPLSDGEVVTALNTLLEAERAGAKVLAAILDSYIAESDAWLRLRLVQRDEARNCAILIRLIRNIGGTPSTVTGDFVAKCLAVEGETARLAFLNRGQAWVARKIAEYLPRITDATVREALIDMHASHLANVEACEALIDPSKGDSNALVLPDTTATRH